jgi:hypothetical protein
MLPQEAARAEAAQQRSALHEAERQLQAALAARRAAEAEGAAREGALAARLQATQRECAALLELMEGAEGQHAEVGAQHTGRFAS